MIWKHIGGTLLELEVRLPTGIRGKWGNLLATVSENCRLLTSILLNNPLDDPDVRQVDYAQFLSSYNSQLVNAEVHSLSEDNLLLVSDACKNLRCTLDEDGNRFGRISALGRRIRKLKIDLETVEDWETLSGAMRTCSWMEELILSSIKKIEAHCLEYLLQRNEALEFLYVREVDDDKSVESDTLEIIGNIIGAIRRCVRLQKVRISFPTRQMPPETTMRDRCTAFRIYRHVKFHFSFVDKAFEDAKLYI